jgi:predicted metal-dependent peptidase
MSSDIRTKLSAARTRLILDQPFIGALVMHLTMLPAAWCRTTATDARAFYYNPGYIAGLNLDETQFVLAHEALHCALGHFARRAHRVKRRWDIACDYAVNLLLIADGMTPPRGALCNLEYSRLAAEEIYPLIPLDACCEILDQHVFDDTPRVSRASTAKRAQAKDGGGDPVEDESGSCDDRGMLQREDDSGASSELPRPESAELQQLAQVWQSRLAAAAEMALRSGRLSAAWLRQLEHLAEPQLPWRALLAHHLMSAARDDYSFERGSRREGEALLPRLSSQEIHVVAALDTSGSISDEEMRGFVSEVDALKGQVRATVTLHACDDKLCPHGPWVFHSWAPCALPQEIGGGGGTDFRPVFEWVEREHARPDLLIYFTDAQGEFPARPPDYYVIWLVKGRAKTPWGERIQLN